MEKILLWGLKKDNVPNCCRTFRLRSIHYLPLVHHTRLNELFIVIYKIVLSCLVLISSYIVSSADHICNTSCSHSSRLEHKRLQSCI
jgi:hypothetical protein